MIPTKLDAWGNSSFRQVGKQKGWFLPSKAEQLKKRIFEEQQEKKKTNSSSSQSHEEEQQDDDDYLLESWQEDISNEFEETKNNSEKKLTHSCLNGGSCSIPFEEFPKAYECIVSDFVNNILLSISEFALPVRPVYFDIDGWSSVKPDNSNTLSIEQCAHRAISQFFESNRKVYVSKPSHVKEKIKPDGSTWYKVALHIVVKEAIVSFEEHIYIAEAFCQELEKAQSQNEIIHTFDVEKIRHIVDMDVLESEKKSHLRMNFTQKAEACPYCQSSRKLFISINDQIETIKSSLRIRANQKNQEKLKLLYQEKKKHRIEIDKCKECSGIGKKFSNSHYSLFRILDDQGEEDLEEYHSFYRFDFESDDLPAITQTMVYQLTELDIRTQKEKRTDFSVAMIGDIQSHVFDSSTKTWVRKSENMQRVHHTSSSSSSISSLSAFDSEGFSDFMVVKHIPESDSLCREWISLIRQERAEWNDLMQLEPAEVILCADNSEREKIINEFRRNAQKNKPFYDIRPNFFVKIPIANAGGGMFCCNVSSENYPSPNRHKSSPIYFVVKFSRMNKGIWQRCTNRNRNKKQPNQGRNGEICPKFSTKLNIYQGENEDSFFDHWKETIFEKYIQPHKAWMKITEIAQKYLPNSSVRQHDYNSLLNSNSNSQTQVLPENSYYYRKSASKKMKLILQQEKIESGDRFDFQQIPIDSEFFQHYSDMVDFLEETEQRYRINKSAFHKKNMIDPNDEIFVQTQDGLKNLSVQLQFHNRQKIRIGPPVIDQITLNENQTVQWNKLQQEDMTPLDNLISDFYLKQTIEDIKEEIRQHTNAKKPHPKKRLLPVELKGSSQSGLCMAPLGTEFGEYTFMSLKNIDGIASFCSFPWIRSYNDFFQNTLFRIRNNMYILKDKPQSSKLSSQEVENQRRQLFELYLNKKKLSMLQTSRTSSQKVKLIEELKKKIEEQSKQDTPEIWSSFSKVIYSNNNDGQGGTNPCAFQFIQAARCAFVHSSSDEGPPECSTLNSSSSSSCFYALAFMQKIEEMKKSSDFTLKDLPSFNFFTSVDKELEDEKKESEEKKKKRKDQGIRAYLQAIPRESLEEIKLDQIQNTSSSSSSSSSHHPKSNKSKTASKEILNQLVDKFRQNQEVIETMKQKQNSNLFSPSNLDTFERVFTQVCPKELETVFEFDPNLNDIVYQTMSELSQQVESYEGEHKQILSATQKRAKSNSWANPFELKPIKIYLRSSSSFS